MKVVFSYRFCVCVFVCVQAISLALTDIKAALLCFYIKSTLWMSMELYSIPLSCFDNGLNDVM